MRTCDRKLQADESCQHRFATLINGFYTCTAHSYLFYFYIFEVEKKAVKTMLFSLWVEGEKVIKCAAKQRFGSSKISRFSHLANHVCILGYTVYKIFKRWHVCIQIQTCFKHSIPQNHCKCPSGWVKQNQIILVIIVRFWHFCTYIVPFE